MSMVNIIGAGLAGLSAALELAENGKACRLISVLPSERAQSVMAEGGINAALDTMGEHDSPQEHYNDTMKGGVYLADPNAVWGLCSSAPEIVRKLFSLGAPLEMNGQDIVLRNFGGQKKKRTAYAKTATGKILMTSLIDEVRKYECAGLIQRYPHHEFVRVLFSENKECNGVEIADTYSGRKHIFSGAVIIAGGGMNCLFPELTTGTTVNTGDITAELFFSGVELANLEMIQYHPTTAAIPKKRFLITEAARGEGGRLFAVVGGEKKYFMEEKYPELGNLMPRDVVSREIMLMLKKEDCSGVYLDMTHLDKSVWKGKLSQLREEYIHFLAVDPKDKPVAVSPAIHYFMGGIYVDECHRTSINGLYAAGECACQYHGANRLGGNSMLGAIYGGKVAARNACEYSPSELPEEVVYEDIYNTGYNSIIPECAEVLKNSLGVFRNAKDLKNALDTVTAALSKEISLKQKKRMILAQAVLMSALAREESRGAHTREDFPEKNDDKFRKTTIARYDGEKISISFRDIPERRS